MNIIFFVDGIPAAQPRQRHRLVKLKAGGQFIRNYVPGDNPIHSWKERIAWTAKAQRPEKPIAGAIKLHLVLYFPRPKQHFNSKGKVKPGAPRWKFTRPDFDNLAKGVADVLTNLGYWNDDGQVSVCIIEKLYGERAGMMVTVAPLAFS